MKTLHWPRDRQYRDRYFVPDLSPEQRPALKGLKPDLIFIAESPHRDEVAPESMDERRPLCGSAGRELWKVFGEILVGESDTTTRLERQLALCRAGRFAVMNAVQFPLDMKIVKHEGETANPIERLGFTKDGLASYEKLASGRDVTAAVEWLRARLTHPSLADAAVVPLGKIADWFVSKALGDDAVWRVMARVSHPAAWKYGTANRVVARQRLEQIIIRVPPKLRGKAGRAPRKSALSPAQPRADRPRSRSSSSRAETV